MRSIATIIQRNDDGMLTLAAHKNHNALRSIALFLPALLTAAAATAARCCATAAASAAGARAGILFRVFLGFRMWIAGEPVGLKSLDVGHVLISEPIDMTFLHLVIVFVHDIAPR